MATWLPGNSGLALRIINPNGGSVRPEQFLHADALYLTGDTYAATVVRQDESIQKHVPICLAWIYPEEVRLLASLALAIPEGSGMVTFIPSRQFHLEGDLGAVDTEEAVATARLAAQRIVRAEFHERRPDFHDWAEAPVNVERVLFEGIDPRNALLIRSLYCLLKAARLGREHDLMEEAVISVQIAREGALELIRTKLRHEGVNNPSHQDAHAYLETRFVLGDALADYFREQHELWIATRHPSSRFGEVWAPPLQADDMYETYEALISVFRHLIIGEPGRLHSP